MKKAPEVYSGYNQGDLCPKCKEYNLSAHPVGVYGYYKKVIERKCMCGYVDYPDTQFKPNLVLVDLANKDDLLLKVALINEVIQK